MSWWRGLQRFEKIFLVGIGLIGIGAVFGDKVAAMVRAPERIQWVEFKADSALTLAKKHDRSLEVLPLRVDSILETLRAIDRRTCLADAITPADREVCVRR